MRDLRLDEIPDDLLEFFEEVPSRNHHPTVKSLSLMRWLCRLVTPPGGRILDPFCGSGTTGIAAVLEDFDFIGVEREAEYVEIARARIDYWNRQPKQLELAA
jgi:DNA modification methylase